MKCLRGFFQLLFQLLSVSFFLLSKTTSNEHCPRGASRLVRQVLEKNFYPVFESYGVNMSLDCPLSKSRDIYYMQEQHKVFEHNARWSCDICGKAFYKQEYIDLHMEKKHQDLMVKNEDSPICLAEYCQLFRCEALDHRRRNSHFWSKALCNKERMKNLKRKCLSLIQSCMLDMMTTGVYKQIYDEIVDETCSLINCKDYWQPLHYELSSYEVLYYITFTPFFICIAATYYYNVWEHYFGDESEDRNDETDRRKVSTDSETISGLRNRFTSSRFEY